MGCRLWMTFISGNLVITTWEWLDCDWGHIILNSAITTKVDEIHSLVGGMIVLSPKAVNAGPRPDARPKPNAGPKPDAEPKPDVRSKPNAVNAGLKPNAVNAGPKPDAGPKPNVVNTGLKPDAWPKPDAGPKPNACGVGGRDERPLVTARLAMERGRPRVVYP
ncbi:hypothetical protein CRG98_007326 [Punica granatum]|uniref:Uncharacterized protein n=1 Tax=Punica granatum TaxID=22663 RepID=A0A2I0KUW5_PUNGR|nr:hypothetical protein CRG98_007326 [Punica granatum]